MKKVRDDSDFLTGNNVMKNPQLTKPVGDEDCDGNQKKFETWIACTCKS